MLSTQVVLRERCASVTVFACRRRSLLGAEASGERSTPPLLARTVPLMATCGLLVMLSALELHAQDACAPRPRGMVAWWPMDEVQGAILVIDHFGGYHGTPYLGNNVAPIGPGGTAGPASIIGEHVLNSLHLGPKRYIQVGNAPRLNFGTSEFTIDAWVKFTQPLPGILEIVNKLDFTGRGCVNFTRAAFL